MRNESPQEVIHAAPFWPFAPRRADGSQVGVTHPDSIAPPAQDGGRGPGTRASIFSI